MLWTSIELMKENGITLAKARSRRYPTWTITDIDYADDAALLTNTSTQTESLLQSLEWATGGIGLHVNADKTEFICFNQRGDISTLNSKSLILVDKFIYLGSSISSTENGINTQLAKTWIAINRLSVIWKLDLSDKIKRSFFQAVVESVLQYGCTTWMLTVSTKQQLYGNLLPISKTIQVKQTRHVGHCWRSKDELIINALMWTPLQGWARVGWPARTYQQQLSTDTGWTIEDLLRVMDDRYKWQ